MWDSLPAIAMGLLVVGFGVLTSWWEWQRRGRAAADPALSPEQRRELTSIWRRRLQVSVLLIIIGIAIPAGDALFEIWIEPIAFLIYWMVVIGLAGWCGFLALGDWYAMHTRLQAKLADVEARRRALEHEFQTQRLQRSNPPPAELN